MMPQENFSIDKPGERALAMVKIIDDLQVFKKPFPATPKPKVKAKKVLDEDRYTEVIENCNYLKIF